MPTTANLAEMGAEMEIEVFLPADQASAAALSALNTTKPDRESPQITST